MDTDCHTESNRLGESMTLRQRAGYTDIANWAESVGLQEELNAIYLSFNLDHYKYSPLGNIIEFLSSEKTLKTLDQWSDNQAAQILEEFISTYISSSQPTYHSIGSVSDVRKEYKNQLQSLYLIALVTQSTPKEVTEELSSFYTQFKLWLIVQNLNRLIHKNYSCDYYIQRLSSQLFPRNDQRDRNKQFKGFAQLQKNFKVLTRGVDCDFEQFSNALVYAAKHIPNDDAPAEFITSITNVAQGITKEINSTGKAGSLERPNFKFTNKCNEKPIDWDSTIYDSNEEDLTSSSLHEQLDLIPFSQHPDDQRNLISGGDKVLSENSVLMQTTEEKHFLKWTMDQPLPHETPVLRRWISELLVSEERNSQAAGIICWLSLWLSRSPVRSEAIQITDEVQHEWSISNDLTHLHRLAPQRHNSKNIEPQFESWVRPCSESYRLLLPDSLSNALKIIKARTNKIFQLNTIKDFWDQTSSENFRSWWINNIPKELSRLSPALLGKHWQQNIFEETNNPTFVKLITSHPRSAQPGSSAYLSITGEEAEAAHQLQLESSLHSSSSICLGSRLDLNDEIFREAVTTANTKIDQSALSDPILHHNQVTAYIVTSLFAATGSRPVIDPFESPLFFNLSEGFVYIEDKNDGHTHTGRLCPLCPSVIQVIERYLEHLKRFSRLNQTLAPSLSKEIIKLSKCEQSDVLPFFFFLSPRLDWYRVSASSLAEIDLFNCPLPANILRHRFVQFLTRSGVDAEVIEGWCGHAERDVETYSDYSCRSWKEDKEKYIDHLERAFKHLNFSQPQLCDIQINSSINPASLTNKKFGIALRKTERSKSAVKAIKRANLDLRLYLDNQGISFKDIESEHTDELTKIMLFKSNGTPQPRAGLRYQHLIKILEGVSLTKAKKVHASKRYRIPESGISLTTPIAVHACELADQLREILIKCCQTDQDTSFHISKISQTDGLITASILLCLESRICSPRFLHDVMCNKGFALIRHGADYYLRYTEHPELGAAYDPAIQKRISSLAAQFISAAIDRKKVIQLGDKIPKHLTPLVKFISSYKPLSFSCSTPKELIYVLCRIMDQSNLVHLPGILCGELSGRVISTSFSVVNWAKTMKEERYLLADGSKRNDAQDTHLNFNKLRSLPKGRTASADNDDKELYTNALTFYSAVKKSIPGNNSANIAKAVKSLSKKWSGKVSSSVLLVSEWFEDRLRRGNLRTPKDLKESTIKKYWGLMSNVVQELGYNTDLMLMDEEEITAFYQSCFEYRKKKKNNEDFYIVLSNFIQWSTSLGITPPLWDEIDIPISARSVRPGFILESDHLATISSLIPEQESVDDEELYAAFIQICSYRYGLRLMEAAGLLREDICLPQDGFQPVIFVRRNKYRDLKTFSSRRVVPLLFELTSKEIWVIQKVLSNYDSCIGERTNGPLLFIQPDTAVRLPPITPHLSRIAQRLNRMLKQVTQNEECVFHDNRHSFANIVTGALLDIIEHLPSGIFPPTANPQVIREILLGNHHEPCRRSAMALARLMGHASPRTTFRSYIHIIPFWSDALVPQDPTNLDLNATFNTDELIKPEPLECNTLNTANSSKYEQLQLLDTFKLLRLVSIGKNFQHAGSYLNLSPETVWSIERTVISIGSRMEYGRKKGEKTSIKGRDDPLEFISRVNDESWARILDVVKQNGIAPFDSLIEFEPINPMHLLGKTRQVQLVHVNDFAFVRTLLDYFRTPISVFRTTCRSPIPDLVTLSQRYGFELIPHEESGAREAPLRLDSNLQHSDARSRYIRTSDFISLIIERNQQYILRNSFDLALCVVAVGIYLEFSRHYH